MSNIYALNQPANPIWDLLREVGGYYTFAHPGQHENDGPEENTPRSHAQETNMDSQRASDTGRQEPRGGNTGIGCGRGGRNGRCGPSHGHRQGGWGGPWWAMNQAFWGARNDRNNAQRAQARAEPFDLHTYFENLGSQIGTSLREALNNRENINDNVVDFVPRADIFDTQTQFMVHISLPGAQKPDISIDYDTVNSTLCVAGVVYRPGIDEVLNDSLVLGGRDREVGVFERQIHLGTRNEPANVDVDKISAKLSDGILAIALPKRGKQEQPVKKRVSVETPNQHRTQDSRELEIDVRGEDGATESEVGDAKQASLNPTVKDEEENGDFIRLDVD